MESLKIRLLIITITFGLLVGGLGGTVLYYLLPHLYPSWYLGIVFFFLIIESCLAYGVAAYAEKATSVKMVNMYMLSKVVKMLAALGFIMMYYISVKAGIRNFVLVFIVFYALYLFFETFLFFKIEKRLKQMQSK